MADTSALRPGSRERSAILTATGGSLDVCIERDKLIATWEDDGLAERDGHAKYPKAFAAQLGDDDRTWLDGEDDDPGASSLAAGQEPMEPREDELDQNEAEDMDIDSYTAAQSEEAEALAAIHEAQRTLRQAREAQAESRLNRGFYRAGRPANPGRGGGRATGGGSAAGSRRPMSSQSGGRGSAQTQNKGQRRCSKCGGAHWLRDCPDRQDPRHGSRATSAPEASAKVATCKKELKFNPVAAMVASC